MQLIFLIIFGVFLFFAFVVFRGAPYVPSHHSDIKQALTELYPLSKKDVLIDVGSGDGVVLRTAAHLHVGKAIGYELQPFLAWLSRWLCRKYPNITIHLVDFWLTSIDDGTTVVYAFMVTRDVKKLVYKLENESARLGRSLYLISYGNVVPGLRAIKEVGAYALYKIQPLQTT